MKMRMRILGNPQNDAEDAWGWDLKEEPGKCSTEGRKTSARQPAYAEKAPVDFPSEPLEGNMANTIVLAQ